MKRASALFALSAFLCGALAANAAQPRVSTTTLMSKLTWRSIGPAIGGRVVAVAGVPSEPDLFYMGGVEGGIWRSTNYGQSWENISDATLPRTASSIGALAVAPSNPRIIYAGTGEGDIRGDFDTGTGVYKSTDAGKTWRYAGLSETHTIASLAIDPRDPNVVYASSEGHVFRPDPHRGVFKTTDGGHTWHRVLYVNDRTGSDWISMNPHDPSVLYAAMWQERRTPWHLDDGGPGSGLYKSVDAGAHWTSVSAHPGFAHPPFGKIGVSVSPANPRIVYAIVQAHDGGVFRSNDAGATWRRVNSQWMLRQRGFYYMRIFADPVNVNVAYVPNVDALWKTTDGGRTWKPVQAPHGDHHIVWVNPRHPNILLEGNDGGATVSVDGGKTWSSVHNQPTGQFYHIAIDNEFPYHVYGAQQDEGSFEGPSASYEGLTNALWHSVAAGESTYVAPDPHDPNVTFGAGYYSDLAKMNMVTGNTQDVSPWARYISGSSSGERRYRFGWTHPILFSPNNPDELFETAQVVFKSLDGGKTWTVVSPDLTRNNKRSERPSGGPVDLDQTGVETFPDIASFAISPESDQVMWAGSADGLVHVSRDGGAHWSLVTPPHLPQWAQISSIEPSHVDAGTAYLTANRFQWDDFAPYVYETNDYGAHWTKITSGIPSDQYVFVVRQDPRDPRVLFAGTRSNVYVSLNGGSRWRNLSLNLPGVQMRDIAIDARQGQVAVATHGRSFWVLDNLALLEQLADRTAQAGGGATLFAPETAWLSHAYGGGGFGDASGGENPQYGATVFFHIPSNWNGRTPVTLSFVDSSGRAVNSYRLHLRNKKEKPLPYYLEAQMAQPQQLAYDEAQATEVNPGMNAFDWDLRYPHATEVRGLHITSTDDFSDAMIGPTVVPGTYTAVLDYGGTTLRQGFHVALDPRIQLAPDALANRLQLATEISGTLDRLNGTINAALAAEQHATPARRTAIAREIAKIVQFKVQSDEGDLLHETKLRDSLAFLMNALDQAYDAPTAAQYAAYDMMNAHAQAAIAKLGALMR
ncbi:MAG: VPS10 domain-containing protein [Candidatus Tyrphobacter sp.]